MCIPFWLFPLLSLQKRRLNNMRKEQVISTTNNNQMEEKGMMSRFIHFKKRFVPALSGALMGVMLMSTTCFAAGTGTSAVTQPLENLKTLIIAVIGAVGVIILAKNVMEFAQAYQQQEKKLLSAIAASDGKDTVVIYVENPRAMKQLGANQTVHGDEALLKQLEELFGEENVKLM